MRIEIELVRVDKHSLALNRIKEVIRKALNDLENKYNDGPLYDSIKALE